MYARGAEHRVIARCEAEKPGAAQISDFAQQVLGDPLNLTGLGPAKGGTDRRNGFEALLLQGCFFIGNYGFFT